MTNAQPYSREMVMNECSPSFLMIFVQSGLRSTVLEDRTNLGVNLRLEGRGVTGTAQLMEGPTHWGLALEFPWHPHTLGTGGDGLLVQDSKWICWGLWAVTRDKLTEGVVCPRL